MNHTIPAPSGQISRNWLVFNPANGSVLNLVGTREQVLLSGAELLAARVEDITIHSLPDWEA